MAAILLGPGCDGAGNGQTALAPGAIDTEAPSTATIGAALTVTQTATIGGPLTVTPTVAPQPVTPVAPASTPLLGLSSPTAVLPTPKVVPTAPLSAPSVPTPSSVDAAKLAERSWAYLTELTRDYSPRTSATEQETRAADYLAGVYRSFGYATTIQAFDVEVLSTDPPVLRVDQPSAPAIDAVPLHFSAETDVGSPASGQVAHVGMVLGDLPAGSLTGKVALVQRGTIPFELKVSRVAQAGAIAAIIYNNLPGQFNGTLQSRSRIPAVSISTQAGRQLLDLVASGPVRATVSVQYETRPSRNVVAEMAGADPTAGVVILGGHFDTVPGVPGANDNGSGVATLLAIAEALAVHAKPGTPSATSTSGGGPSVFPFTVRFIDFGSEELGLEGSRHYVGSLSTEERGRIIGMMNFDALGTGSSAGVFGTEDLVGRALKVAGDAGLSLREEASIQGGASDFAPFEAAGVPFLFFLADDFSRIHTAQDTVEYIAPSLMGTAAAVAVSALMTF